MRCSLGLVLDVCDLWFRSWFVGVIWGLSAVAFDAHLLVGLIVCLLLHLGVGVFALRFVCGFCFGWVFALVVLVLLLFVTLCWLLGVAFQVGLLAYCWRAVGLLGFAL